MTEASSFQGRFSFFNTFAIFDINLKPIQAKMNKYRVLIASILLISSGIRMPLKACTAFCLEGDNSIFLGKNYDWSTGIGLLIYNPANTKVTSFPIANYESIEWQSKYASLTFNQYGSSMPNGGINEKGLAIEVLWLGNTKYSAPENKSVLNELQWVQYMLDNCSTVDEMIEECKQISIKPVFGKLHYFAADQEGRAALIEFIDGKIQIYNNENLPLEGITNDTYTKSLDYYNRVHKIKKKTAERIESRNASLNRFARMASALKNKKENCSIENSFNILNDVKLNSTKWSIVYDLKNLTIYYKTNLVNGRKSICLSDLKKTKTQKCIDLNSLKVGEVSDAMDDFTAEMNYELIRNSTRIVGVPISNEMVESFAYFSSNKENSQKVFKEYYEKVGNIEITITNLKKNTGYVYLGIYDSKEDFQKYNAFNGGVVSVDEYSAKIILYNIPLNKEYAISYYHDENNNQQLDMNILGIPKEKYGFSGKGRAYEKAIFSFTHSTFMKLH